MLLDPRLAQSLLGELPSVADRNKQRDLQLDNMRRVETSEHSALNGELSLTDNHLQMKIQFYLWESHWRNKLIFKGRLQKEGSSGWEGRQEETQRSRERVNSNQNALCEKKDVFNKKKNKT